MVAKAIEAFIRTEGGDMNCRFTGHVANSNTEGLFFRVAKRFLSFARHFTTNWTGTPKLSKSLSFSIMEILAVADKMAAAAMTMTTWPPSWMGLVVFGVGHQDKRLGGLDLWGHSNSG